MVLLYLSEAIFCHWWHTEALIKTTINIGIGRSLNFFNLIYFELALEMLMPVIHKPGRVSELQQKPLKLHIPGFLLQRFSSQEGGIWNSFSFSSLLFSYTVRFGNNCLYTPPWGVFILLYSYHSALWILLFRTFSHK